MSRGISGRRLAAFIVLLVVGSGGLPAQITVTQLGGAGWFADDSRNAAGDLVGLQSTHYGRPGLSASSADDLALAQRLNFTANAASPNGVGSLTFVLDAQPGQKTKSTISLVNETGFGPASLLADGNFSASYVWSESAAQSWNHLAFRFGLRSAHWGTGEGQSQAGFTVTRTGEAVWDLILVYVPPAPGAGTWATTELTADTPGWKVYFQAENTFWSGTYGLVQARAARSLAGWSEYDYDSSTPGLQSILDGATITSIQFGLGSATGRQGEAYLAEFETSLLENSYVFAAVPEPATSGLAAAIGALVLVLARRRLFQRHTT